MWLLSDFTVFDINMVNLYENFKVKTKSFRLDVTSALGAIVNLFS